MPLVRSSMGGMRAGAVGGWANRGIDRASAASNRSMHHYRCGLALACPPSVPEVRASLGETGREACPTTTHKTRLDAEEGFVGVAEMIYLYAHAIHQRDV